MIIDQLTYDSPAPLAPAAPDAPVRQVRGHGVYATFGDVTLLCSPGPGQHARVGALVSALATAAGSMTPGSTAPGSTVAGSQPSGGRRLSQLLAGLLGSAAPDEFPALCAFGPVEGGIAAVVYGPAELVLTVGGRELCLDGRTAVSLVDRIVRDPVDSIRAAIGDPGTGLHVTWSTGPAGAPPLRPTQPRANRVVGVYCMKRHFNDPAVAYCAICGISMVQAHGKPVWGSRPQLGVVVLDDGTVSALVRDHVLGSTPETDPMVAAGLASAVTFLDPLVSPVHARLVLDGWDVHVVDEVDDTFVRRSADRTWTPLPKGTSTTLQPGTAVRCGRRQLHYHSYRSSLNR